MKMFIIFLKEYRRSFAALVLFSAVFAGVLALYDSNAEAVMYSFMICAVIGFFAVSARFLKFRKRHAELEKILGDLPLLPDKLPEAQTAVEEELQNIISGLSAALQDSRTELNVIRRDSSDYFTVWVHQIKTPIAAMQMLPQTEDTELSRELSAELFRVEQYAEMALGYIRLDSGSNDLVIKSCDLDPIIKQAVRRYAPLFIRQKLRLVYEPTDAHVVTDEKWLLFVIEQLLSNAVKYTQKGSVTISFENNILSVSDTGIGIAPEDLPRIFEKGYTGMSGRHFTKSTGLGLYLCQKICGKLGAKLTARSQVGKGSVFSIDLTRNEFILD